jgi:succinate dehydrogenase/fumarate reductase-like Fe-S protein
MSERPVNRTATLRIRRGRPGEASRHEEFAVPFEEGASVLDGLMWIRRTRDPSLAIRYSCINANVCKECTMLIDGVAGYACTARLKEGVTTLDPLPGKDLVRDLVTDTLPPREKLGKDD